MLVADGLALGEAAGADRFHLVGHDWGGVVAWALGRRAAMTTGRWVTGPYRLDVLDGAGHWLPEHHAAELARLVLDHLEDRAPAS